MSEGFSRLRVTVWGLQRFVMTAGAVKFLVAGLGLPSPLVRFFLEPLRLTLVGWAVSSPSSQKKRDKAQTHVISTQPMLQSWGDFIHFREKVKIGMRQSIQVKGEPILI